MAVQEPDINDVRAAARGDHGAFERIVLLYQTYVYNLAYRMTFDKEEAADATQEIFLRIFRKLRQFDTSRAFSPWLYKVASSVCLNRVRADKRRREHFESLPAMEGEPGDSRPAPDPSPVEQSTTRETAELVNRGIEELRPDYRIVVAMRYIEQLSYEEIAESLDLPVGTVKNRLFRAREVLKTALEESGVGPEEVAG